MWGQGIPLRPEYTECNVIGEQRLENPAEADEAGISKRAEAAKTVILVTTSRNRLRLEGQSVVLRGALTTDTFTLFRDYGCKINHLI